MFSVFDCFSKHSKSENEILKTSASKQLPDMSAIKWNKVSGLNQRELVLIGESKSSRLM